MGRRMVGGAENWTGRRTGGCRTNRWTDRSCRMDRQMDRGLKDRQVDRWGYGMDRRKARGCRTDRRTGG